MSSDKLDDSVRTWVESVLMSPVVSVEELRGGLTSTMLGLTDGAGTRTVLRLMTNDPWRTHGAELTLREHSVQRELVDAGVPAPRSLALDADGSHCGVAAHLMTRLDGSPTAVVVSPDVEEMAQTLARIHDVRPRTPMRAYQSWAWEAKWVVPGWSLYPAAWERAFVLLAEAPPAFEPSFIHRDFGHHNLLWSDGAISGVVDWVEASTGPAWLDAAHAATNLAIGFGADRAVAFIDAFASRTTEAPHLHWMAMDVVGFLPPPGKRGFFDPGPQREALDAWTHLLMTSGVGGSC